MSEDADGGIEWGEGDPRVLMVMNVILSSIFATVLVWALDYASLWTFNVVNVVTTALVLTALTYVVTN